MSLAFSIMNISGFGDKLDISAAADHMDETYFFFYIRVLMLSYTYILIKWYKCQRDQHLLK